LIWPLLIRVKEDNRQSRPITTLEGDQDDEVMTIPFTFSGTTGAIARQKSRPVFVDIDPHTYNFDTIALKGAVLPAPEPSCLSTFSYWRRICARLWP
jgi:hypothetical protein